MRRYVAADDKHKWGTYVDSLDDDRKAPWFGACDAMGGIGCNFHSR